MPDAMAPSSDAMSTAPDVFSTAQQQWPKAMAGVLGKYNPQPGDGRMLESWPPGETGAPESPRPQEFPLDRMGVEIFNPSTRPIDVLGDVVSHHLRETDPHVRDYYQRFADSITPEQESHLREQHGRAFRGGERRNFQEWRDAAGLPAWFRGYAFQQWPKEFTDQVYTPEQRAMLDEMMQYLSGGHNGRQD